MPPIPPPPNHNVSVAAAATINGRRSGIDDDAILGQNVLMNPPILPQGTNQGNVPVLLQPDAAIPAAIRNPLMHNGAANDPVRRQHLGNRAAAIAEQVFVNGNVSDVHQALMRANGCKWKNQKVRISRMTIPTAESSVLHELLCARFSVVGLELLNCVIIKHDLMFILRHLRDYHLTSLCLSKLSMDDECAKLLAVAMQETSIKTLDLPWNEIKKQGARLLADALRDSPLESLNLAQNEIGFEGVAYIAQSIMSGQTMLRHLDVSRNNLIDHGAESIAEALPLSRLQKLSVKYNRFTPRGIALICNAVARTRTMKELEIGGNQLGNASCASSISRMLKNSELEVLHIAHSNLTPNELPEIIDGVQACRSLTRLSMGCNQFITENAARDLMVRIRTHPSLREVDLSGIGGDVSADFKAWKDRVVRGMTSNTTKILVMLVAVWSIPRLQVLTRMCSLICTWLERWQSF